MTRLNRRRIVSRGRMRFRRLCQYKYIISAIIILGIVSKFIQFRFHSYIPSLVIVWKRTDNKSLNTETHEVGLNVAPTKHVDTYQHAPPPNLPSWIETFTLPSGGFQRLKIPIVVISNFRPDYLKWCLRYLEEASAYLDPESSCLIVLYETADRNSDDIQQTMALIDKVTFCRKTTFSIKVFENSSPKAFKHAWWKTMHKVFESDVNGDVLFIEEDVIVSPDFLQVLWLSSHVKNTRGKDIFEVTFGGYSGENLINAHPDTIVVRKTSFFQGMAFAVNREFWDKLKNYQDAMLNQGNDDYTAAITALFLVLNPNKHAFTIVVPTLSRMWRLNSQVLSGSNLNIEESLQSQVPWRKISRPIDLQSASVNYGIRDVFGFHCKPEDRLALHTFVDSICPKSAEMFPYEKRFALVCINLSLYFKDKCM